MKVLFQIHNLLVSSYHSHPKNLTKLEESKSDDWTRINEVINPQPNHGSETLKCNMCTYT